MSNISRGDAAPDSVDSAAITDGVIVNADVNASAAIAWSKMASTGQLNIDNLRLDGNVISATDTNGNITLTPDGTGTVLTSSALNVNGTIATSSITIAGASVGGSLLVHAEGATNLAEISLERHSDTAGFGAHHVFARSRGTEASEAVVQSGDVLSIIASVGHDGTDYAQAAQIRVEVDGTPGAGDMPGRILFLTSPDGSETPAEALRISQDKSVTFKGAATGITALTVDNLTIDGNTVTANSGAINLTPAAGSAVVLDGAVSVDAGVITGVTSINFGDEALSAYDEGTFTPTLTAATPGDLSVAYTTQTGIYTQIGNIVHFKLFLDLSTITQTTASGDVIIAGLPVTSDANFAGLCTIHTAGPDHSGTAVDTAGEIQTSGTTIKIKYTRDDATATYNAITDYVTGDTITMTGFYFTV
jgi:hypothetical protein